MNNKVVKVIAAILLVLLVVAARFYRSYRKAEARHARHKTEQTDKNNGQTDKVVEQKKNRECPLLDLSHKPNVVDLGLSVNWSSCNLGADAETDPGMYFAWGEMNPKTVYNNNNFKHIDGYSKRTPLKDEHDVVTVNLGKDWQIPSVNNWEELKQKCKWTWTDNHLNSGVPGYVVIGPSKKSIFLPAVGYKMESSLKYSKVMGAYWMRESYTVSWACEFSFSKESYKSTYTHRYLGCSIRPVCVK